MSRGGRPAAVRRFLRRPWVWVGVVIVAAPVFNWLDQNDQRRHAPGPDALRLEALVEDVAGGSVELAYDNPLTGQRVEARAPVGPAVDTPAEGVGVFVEVARGDPETVRLAGDGPVPTFDAVALALVVGLPLLWCAVRWWSVRATERLAGRPSAPTFAMIGALAGPPRVGRRPCLHLWPLDSSPGSEALCAVPVVVSGGLPVGVAFPLEVKGSPRSFGRIVARAGETVLWPAARSLRAPWMRRPARIDPAPIPLDPPVPGGAGDTPGRPPGFLTAHAPLLLGLAASLALPAAMGFVTLTNQGRAETLYRHGTEVVAEVVERGGSSVTVRYTLPGEAEVRTGRVPVDWPEDQQIGLKLPAVVDPQAPDRLRFLRERYDAAEPVLWAACPAATLAGVLLVRFRTWRRSARVADAGPWRPVTARRRSGTQLMTYLAISSAAETGPALEVRIPIAAVRPLEGRAGRRPIRLEMAGDPDPGSPVALRSSGRILPVASPALVPRAAGPDQPPFRGLGWRAARPGPGPAAS